MITLPTALQQVMNSNNLAGLKPFAYLFRNKWNGTANKYEPDTTPVDISSFIVKPNTLSMTLDVNEVAQYNANNVTLTLSDTENRFVEGTPNSLFPAGYQLYGSRVVLYYGIDNTNKTPIFTGVIKDLPTYKPEKYQVDLKLVSPLEMLKDIEAKDFSDKVTGETLHFEHTEDQHKVYSTAGTGVGGFSGVYADGVKLFEGVDYETDQMNTLGVSALVTIINEDLQNATITADYYTWKTGLTVEQIVAGLVGLAGYDSATEDIRNVVWNTAVKNRFYPDVLAAFQFNKSNNDLIYGDSIFNTWGKNRNIFFGNNFKISFDMKHYQGQYYHTYTDYSLGEQFNNIGRPTNGIWITYGTDWRSDLRGSLQVFWYLNGEVVYSDIVASDARVASPVHCEITINGNSCNIYLSNSAGDLLNVTRNFTFNKLNEGFFTTQNLGYFLNYSLEVSDNNITYRVTDYLTENGFVTIPYSSGSVGTLTQFFASFADEGTQYEAYFRTSADRQNWSAWQSVNIGATIGEEGVWFQFYLIEKNTFSNISDVYFDLLSGSLTLQLVNLSGKTVLEALQDFALISGYEFGVNREGVFFFRQRVQSTTPTYTLGADELVKIDTVKKNLSDFFTKLTLTFAQVPLEFYANTGTRPTLVDKYGVINKEIDKPDIVNYDNPELAQAIGPQLLEVYSALPNMLQAVGKLNLALELADIVRVDRNYNLVQPDDASDYSKFVNQQTYYRACKITGMNYNFEKKQITYTLRDVSNANNSPLEGAEMWEFVYDFPIQLGAK